MAHDPHTKAEFAHRRLIGQLRASDEPGAAVLATVLDACTGTNPCRSAACPACGLAFQQAAVSVVEQFIRVPARAVRGRMTALTIVPASGCLPPDDLTVAACRWVASEITTALATLALPPTIVGLEISFNENTTGEAEPHWCIHAHGIGLDWLSDGQVAGLRATFPPSPLVKRPVRCDALDQDPRGRLYPFKPERVRRITRLVEDDPNREPYRDSKPRALRPWQAASLAIVEHRLGFGGRLLTHGIECEALRRHLRAIGWPRDGP